MGVHVIDDDDAARNFLMFLFKAAKFSLRAYDSGVARPEHVECFGAAPFALGSGAVARASGERNCRSGILGGACGGIAARDDHIRQGLSHRRRPFDKRAGFAAKTARHNREILALGEAVEVQLIEKGNNRRRLHNREYESKQITTATSCAPQAATRLRRRALL